MKNKTERKNKIQEIKEKRGTISREREKKFLFLRNTKQYGDYYNQKRGIEKESHAFDTSKGSGIPQVSNWNLFKTLIKKIILWLKGSTATVAVKK